MPTESAMNGGVGEESYSKNSKYQRGIAEAARDTITEGIHTHFAVSSTTYRVADFGCSTGPNTFVAVQTIVDAICKKMETAADFQVFFNDRTSNDFNTLFASLPPEGNYYAAGVPGSFHHRRFPKDSLHFAHSSCTLNWLSVMPNEILDSSSPAWNHGRIMYSGEREAVLNAYAAQYGKDLDSFFKARAQELVFGGLMALVVPTVPNPVGGDISTITFPSYDLLGTCLVDLADKGRFDMSKVDSFNLPVYYTYPDELKAIIARNEDFNIESIEAIEIPSKYHATPDPRAYALTQRAVFEGLLKDHFGAEFMDELFDLYEEKIEQTSILTHPKETSMVTFVLLKCIRTT